MNSTRNTYTGFIREMVEESAVSPVAFDVNIAPKASAPAGEHYAGLRVFGYKYAGLAAFLLVFGLLRVIYLRETLVWVDDILTVPSLEFVPWAELPDVILKQLSRITGPILPTVIDSLIVNLFGADVLLLRLPSLFVSVMGALMLLRVLHQLFPHDIWARWIPLTLYTLSVPSIIYAQQIQPTIYYFLATLLQLSIFIPFYRTDLRDTHLR